MDTKRPRGRPTLPLQEDPERHWLAYFCMALAVKPPEATDREIARRTMTLRFGVQIFDSKEVSLSRRYIYVGKERGSQGRRTPKVFHHLADDLCRKRLRVLDTASVGELEWLDAITQAWIWTVAAPSRGQPVNECLERAWRIVRGRAN
jgi:hypothetical protein